MCGIDECKDPILARDLCKRHYSKWHKYGDPLAGRMNVRRGGQGKGLNGESIHREVGYGAAHSRVKRLWGPANVHLCVQCGSQAGEWAYDGTDPMELCTSRRNILGLPSEVAYSRYPEFYMPMCRGCHVKMDRFR